MRRGVTCEGTDQREEVWPARASNGRGVACPLLQGSGPKERGEVCEDRSVDGFSREEVWKGGRKR